MKTYRLGSSGLVFAPGFVAYLRNAARTQKAWAIKTLRAGWGLSKKAAETLLLGPPAVFTIEGDVVVLTTDEKEE